jgi:RNA polymerase-binding protein DksA
MARRAVSASPVGRRRLKAEGNEWRRALEAILRERRHFLEEAPAARAGGADPADAAREREEEMVWLAVLDRGRGIQAQVDEALCRMAAGRYGLCAACGEPIPPARLRALPFAVRCLQCQERLEERRGPAAARGVSR